MTIEWKWFQGVDITGTKAENKKTETIDLSDKTCRYIVPSYTPYFEGTVVMKNEQGGIIHTGYEDLHQDVEAERYTGKKLKMFLEINENILNNNASITITYQALSNYNYPRNGLLDLWASIKIALGGDIDWNTQVINKPDTFPSEFHTHNMEAELRGFEEFIYFMELVKGYLPLESENTDDMIEKLDEYWTRLYQIRDTYYNLALAHDSNYEAPHQPTKGDIGLGNVDNFKLATLQEDLDGVAADKFSTPHGATQAIKQSIPDTQGLLKANGLPFSFYGDMTFLPPPIDGSFEGIGAVGGRDMGAMCLESSGDVLALNSHCDGKSRGLYFNKCSDYKTSAQFTYTADRYVNPTAEKDGVIIDIVVAGSGKDVILVADGVTGQYFVAASNGTLNPSAHNLIPITFSHISAGASIIHVFGDWVYVLSALGYSEAIGNSGNTFNRANGQIFFERFPFSALTGTTPIVAEAVNVNYTNLSGTAYTAQPSFRFDDGTWVLGSDSVWRQDKYIFHYNPPVDWVYINRRLQCISALKSGTTFYLKFFIEPYMPLSNYNGQTYLPYTSCEINYEFNTANNTLTVGTQNTIGGQTLDVSQFVNNNYDWLPYKDELGYANLNRLTSSFGSNSLNVLNNGDLLLHGAVYNGLPYACMMYTGMGATNVETVSKRLNEPNFPNLKFSALLPISFDTPIGIGIQAGPVVYDDEGEYTLTLDSTSTKYAIYRKVTGEYFNNPDVTNLFTPVLSRNLSNQTYQPSGTKYRGMIGITGSASKLASGGMVYGQMLLSINGGVRRYGVYTTSVNNSVTPVVGDGSISLDYQFTKDINEANKTYNLNTASTIYYPKSIIDKLTDSNGLITQSNYKTRNMAWLIGDHKASKVPIPNHITIQYCPEGTSTLKTVVVIFTATYIHSGNVYTVDDVTILHSYEYDTFSPVSLTDNDVKFTDSDGHDYFYTSRIYLRDDGLIDIFVTDSCNRYQIAGDNQTTTWLGKLNSNTGELTVISTNSQYYRFDRTQGMKWNSVYNVGMCISDTGTESRSGYSPTLVRKLNDGTNTPAGSYYVTTCPYPSSLWTVFFKSQVSLVLGGVKYIIQPGNISLLDITPSPANKTFYIYATVLDGLPQYVITEDALTFDSDSNLLVGKVTTDNQQIVTIEKYKPFAVGGKVINTKRYGSSIPGSSGGINDPGSLPWVYSSELH